jgi:hypothetical protein
VRQRANKPEQQSVRKSRFVRRDDPNERDLVKEAFIGHGTPFTLLSLIWRRIKPEFHVAERLSNWRKKSKIKDMDSIHFGALGEK